MKKPKSPVSPLQTKLPADYAERLKVVGSEERLALMAAAAKKIATRWGLALLNANPGLERKH